ncbi:MAG TPA: alpha/beta hydrolase [Aliidongia sp.]|uniref:alpha/beta fold hydrolase n=1 Tax=Aliidongia sp. TaxID=1914230 RepID=UPI002DDCA1BC|nr:alpha/beta hydrolase [Aliidongia sp.]HEV2673255.1 alpha/beta hydrolase [Aliidongia sp.]
MSLSYARTDILEIVYEAGGPVDGLPVMLLHGWPDAPRAWNGILPDLHKAGFRTIVPFLRGSGPTRFLSGETVRFGHGVALAQDAIDLADRLGIDRFAVIGHDWGARAAYTLAALFSDRISRIAALALAFQPRGAFGLPQFPQARRFWYQWFMALDQGAAAVRADPKGFARIQWDTWSPPGWFDEAEFAATAESFENPDWVAITLNAYRARWRPEATDLRYAGLLRRLATIERLSTPTLMIQGGADCCDEPASSEGWEPCFEGGYKRLVLDGVGHFPQREAPGAVAAAVLAHLMVN